MPSTCTHTAGVNPPSGCGAGRTCAVTSNAPYWVPVGTSMVVTVAVVALAVAAPSDAPRSAKTTPSAAIPRIGRGANNEAPPLDLDPSIAQCPPVAAPGGARRVDLPNQRSRESGVKGP